MMAFNNYNFVDELSIMEENDSPQQRINEQSLTQDLAKNRELLKRKLQTRRSLQQLVDVGIMPSSKTALRQQLQMRKTQDILKNKILSRPDRRILIEHNILPDTTAAPAIQNTQCQLKRARLVDNLNDKLSVRPGILELVANNIFEIDSNLQQVIQNGHIQYPSLSRPIHKKTSSFSTTTVKRSLSSIPKSKSCLTFHEYKGPSQKIEVTKVPLQSTLKSSEYNHYGIQLKQQQLFLELIHDHKDHSIANVNQQSFETMKLVDLKNVCKKLNISSTGTKTKLIEKLKNAQFKMSDTTNFLSQTINNESQIPSFKLLLSTSSLNDHELCQQTLLELDKFKEYDSLPSNEYSPIVQSIDNSTFIQPKCNPISPVQIPNQNLMQQHPILVQTDTSNTHLSSIYHSTSSSSCQSINNDIISNISDEYHDSSSISIFSPINSYINISTSSPITHMDWLDVSSSNLIDHTSDFTQFLNQSDTDYLFDSIYQQHSFNLFSPSN